MTDLSWLDAIEARLAAATPGPWESEASKDKFLNAAAVFADCPCCGLICAEAFDWDAVFIAHAPADIARLVKALRDAHAKIERLRGYADALEENRSALGWDRAGFVSDFREWSRAVLAGEDS